MCDLYSICVCSIYEVYTYVAYIPFNEFTEVFVEYSESLCLSSDISLDLFQWNLCHHEISFDYTN